MNGRVFAAFVNRVRYDWQDTTYHVKCLDIIFWADHLNSVSNDSNWYKINTIYRSNIHPINIIAINEQTVPKRPRDGVDGMIILHISSWQPGVKILTKILSNRSTHCVVLLSRSNRIDGVHHHSKRPRLWLSSLVVHCTIDAFLKCICWKSRLLSTTWEVYRKRNAVFVSCICGPWRKRHSFRDGPNSKQRIDTF